MVRKTPRTRLGATAALWWRMMRMQRVTREGWFYVGFTLVVGAAAINTGNNLLHLVLGLQLSLILLSALLSESVLQRISVRRTLPRSGIAGVPTRVELEISNGKRRRSSYGLVVSEVDGAAAGATVFAERIPAQGSVHAFYELTSPRRGELGFEAVRITTRFPFGFFEKSREQRLPGVLAVHPAGSSAPPFERLPTAAVGERPEPLVGQGGEFHGLRELRPDDDPRKIHWRSTARAGKPLVIEHERERRRRLTLLLDVRGAEEAAVDQAADDAMALSRRFQREGCEVGLSWPGGALEPDHGAPQLRKIGDALARLEPSPSFAQAPRIHPGSQGVVVAFRAPAKVEAPAPLEVRGGRAALAQGERGPSLRRAQRWSLLVASIAGFASLAISGELAVWAIAIFLASSILGFLVEEGKVASFRIGANVLAIGALLVLLLQVLAGSTSVMVAAPTFAVVLAASRLLGRRGAADDSLLLLAAVLMLAGGAALTGELIYGLLFVAFAISGTVALCLTQLRREAEAIGGGGNGQIGRVSPALVSALGALSLTVLIGSSMVFVLFPRVSAGMLQRAAQPQVGGGSDRIELGGVGLLKDNPIPAMRVRFPNGRPPGELYWRTFTFQKWDGKGWSRGSPRQHPVAGAGGLFTLARPMGSTIEAELELLREEALLPTPGEPLALRIPRRPRTPFPTVLQGEDGSVQVAGGGEPRYTIVAGPSREQAELSAEQLEPYLEIPDGLDPRISELSKDFDGEGEPLATAAKMIERFGRDYRYSMELPGDSEDPLADFLFSRREGHCEYFASALTLLLRLQGIPARVATGYYGASFVEGGGYYLVREGDAHAWTEAWVEGSGWVRLDATPAADRPGITGGVMAGILEFIDLARYWWGRNVLDFDSASQRSLVSGVGQALTARSGAGQSLTPIVRLAVVAILLAIAAWLGWKLRRQLGGRRGGRDPAAQREAVALYRALKRELAKEGVRLPPSATAAEWVEAAARVVPERADAFQGAVEAYEQARFGARGSPASKLRSLRRALRRGSRP